MALEEFQAVCTKANLATCVPPCGAETHGYLLSIEIDGRGTVMTCNKVDGMFSWQGQASLGGYIGANSASLFSAVSSGAAGTYMGSLTEDADISTDLVIRAGQVVDISGIPSQALVDVARGKPATQSSTQSNGPAGLAVDGNTNSDYGTPALGDGSCTHTENGSDEWWQVDLGQTYQIQRVDIWHRSDCCQSRLLTATVMVSDTPDFGAGMTCGTIDDFLGEPDETACDLQRGRYVTVVHHDEHITICELRVMVPPRQRGDEHEMPTLQCTRRA